MSDEIEWTPEMREIAAQFEREMQEWTKGASFIGAVPLADEARDALLKRLSARDRMYSAMADIYNGFVTRVMHDMGFTDAEIVAAVATIEVLVFEDSCTMRADLPEQVQAYIAAVQSGDMQRAKIVLHARRG